MNEKENEYQRDANNCEVNEHKKTIGNKKMFSWKSLEKCNEK